MKHLNAMVLYGKDGRYDAAMTLISPNFGEVELIEVMDAPRLRAFVGAFLNIADDLDKLNDENKVTFLHEAGIEGVSSE